MTEPDPDENHVPPNGPARPPRRPVQPDPGPDRRSELDDDDDLFVSSSTDHDHDHDHDDGHPDGWDDDYVELREPRGARTWVIGLVVLVGVLALTAGAGWRWYQHQIDPPGPPGAEVMVEIPAGASLNAISTILDEEGVITSARVFNFYARNRDTSGFQAGTYRFQQNSSFDLALEVLGEGPGQPVVPDLLRVPIPEGLVMTQMLDRITEAVTRFDRSELDGALTGLEVPTALRPPDIASYEGLLFPATYDVDDEMTGPGLLNRMAAEMETRVTQLDPDGAVAAINATHGLDLDLYQVMIVASMVQAEAGNPDEAAQIATVIYNRLGQGMALQIDAVDRYGARLAGTDVDFEDANLPYNSRRRVGLPPTPIAAPGEYALQAAFLPADGDWLYYVLIEPRAHLFTADYDEFLAGKRTCIEADLGCG